MNPVDAYAQSVVDGDVPAGKYHRLACARHLRDRARESSEGFPYRFDVARAEKFFRFVNLLQHYKGEWAGQPIVLQPWQQFILGSLFGWVRDDGLRRFRSTYFEIPRKNGKALALDTPIPTPGGWSTIGELSAGDAVFGPDGAVARVVATTDVMHQRPCYAVTLADGAEIVADAQHEWRVFDIWREREVVLTTAEIAGTFRVGSRGRNEFRYRIPVAASIECARRDDLSIDPYVLGVWLGDGTSNGAQVTTADAEVLEQLQALGERISYTASGAIGHGRAATVGVGVAARRNVDRHTTLHARLRVAGLLNNKHIPASYLRASRDQRLALLQGLMDTDGSVSFSGRRAIPRCEFSTTKPRLRDGVLELIRSLGMKPTVLTYRAMFHGKDCGDVYRVCFTAYADTPVFRLSRKLSRLALRPSTRQRSSTRSVVGVTRVESVPVRCIQVDRADGLYLAGRHFVTTHNSTIAATAALYLTFFDGEPGAEGYTIATKRDQAKIVFNDAKQMIQASAFKGRIGVRVANLHRSDIAAKLEPLGADHDSTDGLNPHVVVVDEWHAYKDRGLIDVMETATGARRQPVVFGITTAGNNPVSPCGDQHDFACKVLDGTLQAESFLAFIAHADPEDDWAAEETARKANPGYGISVKPDDLAAKVVKAINMPSAAATYKQKHLNLWVNADAPCLAVDGWRKGQSRWRPEDMAHEPCYVGIDLASKIDLCALSFVFPPTAGRKSWRWFQRAWTPRDTLQDRAHRDRAPYGVWVEQGWLTAVDGTRIDHQLLRAELAQWRQVFDIEKIGFDPWHADTLIEQLIHEDGFAPEQVVAVPQTYAGMSSACLHVQAEILAGDVDAGGCPMTAWSVSNVVANRDGKDNLMFAKGKSRGRIDPVIAATIATALKLREPVQPVFSGVVRNLAEFL